MSSHFVTGGVLWTDGDSSHILYAVSDTWPALFVTNMQGNMHRDKNIDFYCKWCKTQFHGKKHL